MKAYTSPKLFVGLMGLLALSGWAQAQTFSITRAEWSSSDGGRLRVEGDGVDNRTVTIKNAGSGSTLGTTTVDGDEWDRRFRSLSQVPCRVRAEQSGGGFAERDVANRPANCGPVAGALPTLSINDLSVSEGGTASFAVSLSATPASNVTVTVTTANGSAAAPGDFTARSLTLTFPAGTSTLTQSFAVVTVNDTAAEQAETFSANLSAATNATIARAQGIATIPINDQPVAVTPGISISDVSVSEGGTATFTVRLSAAATQTVSVAYATGNGSALAGSDYNAASGSLSFAPGATSQTVSIGTIDDTAAEQAETFVVNLSNPVNATIADAQGIATIALNDQPVAVTPAISVGDVAITEGGGASFAVSLSAVPSAQVTVAYATAAGTAASPADFTARSGTLTFAANTTTLTQTVVVTTVNDTAAEGSESFTLNLSNPVNATIADAQAVATITDNDFTSAAQAHATMTTYDGPQTCLRCHEGQARQMHGSVHYQQNGETDFVTNIPGKAGEGPAGRPAGAFQPLDAALAINTYCGTHENSPRFTCAGCHVGNGRYQLTPSEFSARDAAGQLKELGNIDCMMCHQQAYKRFPDWTSSGLGFESLSILNAELSPTGTLVPAIGTTNPATRDGLAGIPIVHPTTRDFEFRPSGAPGSLQFALPGDAPQPAMTLTTEQAAQQVHRTTRQSCLNCHARAAAADGAKRGDLSSLNVDPPVALDMHMSAQAGGANLNCSACHNVNGADGKSMHRVKGRGLDLRANDRDHNNQPLRLTCDSGGCHTSTPHANVTNGTSINRHTTKVACQTCHIPTYAKGTKSDGTPMGTETVRNWQKPVLSQSACNGRGGWLPEEVRGNNLRPSYQWFDGTSEIYFLNEPLTATPNRTGGAVPTKALDVSFAQVLEMSAGTPSYVLGKPNGAVNVASAKIYPMKEHWGKLAARTDASGRPTTLVAHSTFEFFRTGSFCRAVALGVGLDADAACGSGQNPNVPAGTTVVPVHTYQTLNHGVEVAANALGANGQCNVCHNGAGSTSNVRRMALSGTGGLGYDLREPATSTGLCNNCHGGENNPGMVSVHDRHRNRSGVTCNSCHTSR